MITFFAALLFLVASTHLALPPAPPAPTAPPAAAADESAPDIVVLDQLPGCYGSVRFDHRLHVGMSTIGGGCTTCHHDAIDGAVIQPCRECHEVASLAVTTDRPGLRGAYHRQCLSCHKDWAHENACGFCHSDSSSIAAAPSRARNLMAMLQPRSSAQSTYVYQTGHKAMPVVTFHHADHTEVFGLQCADCHGGSSCGQCHGPRAERPVINRQDTCYKCHSESRCVSCHHLAERGRFDHETRVGWRLRPAHTNLACTACHGEGHMPARPSSDACRSCHAAESGGEFDHGVTGVVLYGDHALFECVDCHTGGDTRALTQCTGCHAKRPVAGTRSVGLAAATSITPDTSRGSTGISEYLAAERSRSNGLPGRPIAAP